MEQETIVIFSQNGNTLAVEGQGYLTVKDARAHINYFKEIYQAKKNVFVKYFPNSTYTWGRKKYFVQKMRLIRSL